MTYQTAFWMLLVLLGLVWLDRWYWRHRHRTLEVLIERQARQYEELAVKYVELADACLEVLEARDIEGEEWKHER